MAPAIYNFSQKFLLSVWIFARSWFDLSHFSLHFWLSTLNRRAVGSPLILAAHLICSARHECWVLLCAEHINAPCCSQLWSEEEAWKHQLYMYNWRDSKNEAIRFCWVNMFFVDEDDGRAADLSLSSLAVGFTASSLLSSFSSSYLTPFPDSSLLSSPLNFQSPQGPQCWTVDLLTAIVLHCVINVMDFC